MPEPPSARPDVGPDPGSARPDVGPDPSPDPGSSPGPAPLPASWRQRLDLLGTVPPITPARLAAGVAAALVTVVVAILVLRGPPPPPEVTLPLAGGPGDPAATSTTSTTRVGEVLVHAAGAVHAPGVYRLAADARVADLVDAAGGPLAEAELDRLNLAATLADGQQVYVPKAGEAVPALASSAGDGAGAGASPGGLVDLNTAGADELDTLPGVGPATAKAILDERERRGSFSSVEELLDVRGIGDAKLDALRDLVRV